MSEDSQVDPLLTPEQEVSSDGPQDSTSTHLNEDLALSQLKDRDLTAGAIEDISKNSGMMKSRKVRLAIACHQASCDHSGRTNVAVPARVRVGGRSAFTR